MIPTRKPSIPTVRATNIVLLPLPFIKQADNYPGGEPSEHRESFLGICLPHEKVPEHIRPYSLFQRSESPASSLAN